MSISTSRPILPIVPAPATPAVPAADAHPSEELAGVPVEQGEPQALEAVHVELPPPLDEGRAPQTPSVFRHDEILGRAPASPATPQVPGAATIGATHATEDSPVIPADAVKNVKIICRAYSALKDILSIEELTKNEQHRLIIDIWNRWDCACSEILPPLAFPARCDIIAAAIRRMADKLLRTATANSTFDIAYQVVRFLASCALTVDAYRAYRKICDFRQLTQPGVERQLAVAYRRSLDAEGRPLPLFSSPRPSPLVTPWEEELIDALDVKSTRKSLCEYRTLASVVPMRDFEGGENSQTAINNIIALMALRLAVAGWEPGQPPSDSLLVELLSTPGHRAALPRISEDSGGGRALLLNGYHRLIALVIMVAHGLLPASTLDHLPFEEREVGLGPILAPLLRRHEDTPAAFALSWRTLLDADPAAEALMAAHGATASLREIALGRRDER